MGDGTTKTCVRCGADVSGQKRVKDVAGNYYCHPCWAAARRQEQQDEADLPTFAALDPVKEAESATLRRERRTTLGIVGVGGTIGLAVIGVLVYALFIRDNGENNLHDSQVQVQPAAVASPSAPPLPAPAVALTASPQPSETTPLVDKDVRISAKEGARSKSVSLGPIKAGQSITLRYVRGAWTAYDGKEFPPGSPDDTPVAHYNVLPLRLCEARQDRVVELAVVPGGTKANPFVFKADRNIADLVLNNSDARPSNNVGEVTYHVTITSTPATSEQPR